MERPAKELRTIKFQMMMSPAEAKWIDDWRYANRVPTKAEAIRRLIEMAMKAEEKS